MSKEFQDDSVENKRGEGPHPVDIHVGSRLKLRRNQLNMSQEQMGKALGLTFQQIQKYERATNRMGASRLHQMSRLLNVPINWFFEEFSGTALPRFGFSDNKQATLEGAPNTTPDTDIFERRETLDLIRAYYSITDPKQRRKVFELVKSMADDKE
jgi:transcriptional regulator with XRE-family HTH domain